MSNNASPDLIPLLMTRPRAAARAFLASLPKDITAQVTPVYSPLMAIKALGETMTFTPDDAAIFTSANGVVHGPVGDGNRAFCVGEATTKAAADAGWVAEMRGQTADMLVDSILRNKPDQKLIHLCGTHTRGNIVGRLTGYGIIAKNVAVYDQVAQPLTAEARALVAQETPVLVPLFSPRTAALFALEVPRAGSMHIILLSEAVKNELDEHMYASATVADAPDADAMRKTLSRVMSDLSTG